MTWRKAATSIGVISLCLGGLISTAAAEDCLVVGPPQEAGLWMPATAQPLSITNPQIGEDPDPMEAVHAILLKN